MEVSKTTQTMHAAGNIIKLCSKLNDFRIDEKYTDVTIRCADNEIFKCHRIILALASDFFDTIFSSNFSESTKAIICPPEISSQTFGDVLKFIYTGYVKVHHKNVVNILKASELFFLPGIRNLCIEFIKRNKMDVQNTIDSFAFAIKIETEQLIDILSENIAEQMRIFSHASKFLEMPFNEFNIVLKKYTSLPTRKDAVLIVAITEWILRDKKNRGQYFNGFLTMIKDLNSVKHEISNFVSQLGQHSPKPHQGKQTNQRLNQPVSQSDAYACALTHITNEPTQDFYVPPEGLRETMGNSEIMMEQSYLHVYVKYAKEKLMKVFSINKNEDCAFVCKIPINRTDQWMKIVAQGDHLYSFHYIRRNPSEADTSSQSFYVHNSINMRCTFRLKSPPIIFDDISMCSLENRIYTYNQTLSQRIPTANSSNVTFLTDEEVSRCIYYYNYEVDNWFSVPAMKHKLEDSCMTIHNNLLYLIGGSHPNGGPSKNTQAYDHRTEKWQQLQDTKDCFVGADCCVEGSRIYVCGGKNRKSMEIYEPLTGKWESNWFCRYLPKTMIHHRLNKYMGKLWVMGGYNDEGVLSNDLTMHTIPADRFFWDSCSSISTKTANDIFAGDCTILDSVVFK